MALIWKEDRGDFFVSRVQLLPFQPRDLICPDQKRLKKHHGDFAVGMKQISYPGTPVGSWAQS